MKDPADICQVVSDVVNYGKGWKAWWIGCQPPVRAEGSWPFPQESHPDIQWGRLLNGGKYGVFLFMMALSWWAVSLHPDASPLELVEATSDLNWVICQLTASFSVPPTPLPATPAMPGTQDTPQGKHKVKLTEKAIDAGDRVQKRFCR